jgi:hypothetical protein
MSQNLHSLGSPSTVSGVFSLPAIIFTSAFPIIKINKGEKGREGGREREGGERSLWHLVMWV